MMIIAFKTIQFQYDYHCFLRLNNFGMMIIAFKTKQYWYDDHCFY